MGKLFGRIVLVALVILGVWYVVSHYVGTARFGCDDSGSVAHAESADCPTTIAVADEDPQWAAGRWATLSDRKITTGLWYDQDGTEHVYVSGNDADASRAVDVLREVGAPSSPIGGYPAASHVEVKAAVGMRDVDVTRGVMVINNPNGPCAGDLGCATALPRVLPDGATLVVWWRNSSGTMQSRQFPGGAR